LHLAREDIVSLAREPEVWIRAIGKSRSERAGTLKEL